VKVLILGGAGMLGHKLWQIYRERFDTWVTVRSSFRDCERYGLLDQTRTIDGVDASEFHSVVRACATVMPDVVINCIGIIKQRPTAKDPAISLTINSLFPHYLANLCSATGARLIHISTDCIFSGQKGMYREDDVSDAEDLYGRTKFLGEVSGPGCLTLRSSIIGRELETNSGLVEWFLSQDGEMVRGYTRAIYSGFTTMEFSRIISGIIENESGLSGVLQVSSHPIAKYDLLCLLKEAFHLSIDIKPYDQPVIDRSLDSTRFRQITGYKPPSWPEMIAEMASDTTPYGEWHKYPE
jgi:dTDP-4-dehydrorhamnose reductase